MFYLTIFIIGIISAGLGVGGGAILVPTLIYGFKYPFRRAASISLSTIVPITLTGAISHLMVIKQFHLVNYIFLVTFAVIGAVIGGLFVQKIKVKWLHAVFGIFLIIVGLKMLYIYDAPFHFFHQINLLTPHSKTMLLVILGIITGSASVILGVGCGLVLVPLLVYVFNYPMHEAITTSLATMFFLTLTGSIIHSRLHNIDLITLKKIILPALTGAITGVLISSNMPDKHLKLAFGGFIFIMGIKFLYTCKDLFIFKKKKQHSLKSGKKYHASESKHL